MDARKEWVGGEAAERPVTMYEEAWLLGQPPLKDYLHHVRKTVLGGAEMPSGTLVDEWRAANDRYYDLAESEAGIADHNDVRDLDPTLEPLVAEVMADARYRKALGSLPTRFAMVELDTLMVAQQHIDLDHVERLKARLGRAPSAEALFRFCQPLETSEAAVQWRRMGSKKYMAWSESSDFRLLEVAPLGPEQVRDFDTYGPIGLLVGVAIGFGSNFLSVVQSDGRVLLHNGHHRAYALRDLGVTHAPCIVQTVTRRDELNLVASHDVVDNAAYYFKAPRPPLLKDFFDPKLRKVLRAPKVVRVVEVSFEVRDFETRDFALAE